MNLVGTLAKAAIGMMIARGVGKMMGGSRQQQGGGLGGLLGGLTGGNAQQQGGGGLGGLLGGLTGGKDKQQQGGGGLGGLLGGLMGGNAQKQQQTGGGLLGGLAGGAQQGSSGLGGLLGNALSGGGAQADGLGGLLNSLGGAQQQAGGLGGMLNQVLAGQAAPEPQPDENAQAEIMLRGMINAAKADGQIDEGEQAAILEHLGDVGEEELNFVRNEMAQPQDLDEFVASVPKGLEQQVYLMSLLGINLDSQAEAQYLDRLAQGLGISNQTANQIHAQVGVPGLHA